MEIDTQMDIEPSYSYVNKSFHCYTCNRDFKKMVTANEEVICSACNGEFVEEVTRETSSEIQHFSPFLIRQPQAQQPRQTQRPRAEPAMRHTVTYVTQTIGPDGSIITRRVTTGSPQNESGLGSSLFQNTQDGPTANPMTPNERQMPQASPFGLFDMMFGMPFMGPQMPMRFVNLGDILEMSMRDVGRTGAPPASDESIANLEEVDISPENPHKCSICIEDIKEKGVKLPCEHVFDKECVTTWLKQHDTCPV